MSERLRFTIEELREFDEAGFRVIGSLWPGDEFTYRRESYTVRSLSVAPDATEAAYDGTSRRSARVHVVTETLVGEPRRMTNLDGDEIEVQSRVTFTFHPMMMVPCSITDEHFAAEGGSGWVQQVSAGGMW